MKNALKDKDSLDNARRQLFLSITDLFWDDLEVIEKLNDLTYSRKVQLKSKLK